MDLKSFPRHDGTERRLNRIRDPLKRFVEAHSIAADARLQVIGVPPRPHHPEDEGEPSELLVRRNEALMVLHKRYGWTKNRCCRLIEVDRRTLNDRAVNLSSKLPVWQLEEEELKTLALELHQDWLEWASIWRSATEIRDALVRALTDQDGAARLGVAQFGNAELARAAGMNTSLVAQIRRNSMNLWKKANPQKARQRQKDRRNERIQRLIELGLLPDPDAAPDDGTGEDATPPQSQGSEGKGSSAA